MTVKKDIILRVGTFNAYNFALPNVPLLGGNQYSEIDFKNKASWIGSQLKLMDTDIVGFQEIFHEDALREALKYSSPKYADAEVIYKANPRRGHKGEPFPACALVTSLPIKAQRIHTNFFKNAIVRYDGVKVPISEFTHPVIEARITLPTGQDAYVFVAHLKSKRLIYQQKEKKNNPRHIAQATVRSLIRRAAEAVALRALLISVMHKTKTPVILLGDMNADVTATTSEILAGPQPWRYTPYEQKKAMRDVLLYSVKDIQTKRVYHDVYYTHIHNGYYQALDHICVSEEFVRENREHIGIVHNVWVYNDHLVDHARLGDQVEAWQSDHGQVVVEIILNAKNKA